MRRRQRSAWHESCRRSWAKDPLPENKVSRGNRELRQESEGGVLTSRTVPVRRAAALAWGLAAFLDCFRISQIRRGPEESVRAAARLTCFFELAELDRKLNHAGQQNSKSATRGIRRKNRAVFASADTREAEGMQDPAPGHAEATPGCHQ